MAALVKLLLLRYACLFLFCATAVEDFSLDRLPVGVVSEEKLEELPSVLWSKCDDRLAIHQNADGRFARVTYPQGKWGSKQSGAQFLVELPPQREYKCSYRIRFSDDFDFVKGGKLPGLAGGKATAGLKRPSGDGWTARYMWRRYGDLVLYLYHMDQRNKQGDDLSLDVRATPGKWLKLTQIVTVNSDNQSDGRIRVWVDDKLVLDRKNLRLQKDGKAPVNRFYFSTFFGGQGADWAPRRDVMIDFAELEIETSVADPAKLPKTR